MYTKAKVVVAYYDQYDLTGCRLALAVAAGAWDAGAEVRVRCVRRLAPTTAVPVRRTEVLRETAEVREASLHDLAWADAVYFVAAPRGDGVRSELGRLVRFVRDHWGCIVVSGGSTSEGEERGAARRHAEPPGGTTLAAATEEGRRLAEAVLARKVGRRPPAVVA
jgi:hypothetical protein